MDQQIDWSGLEAVVAAAESAPSCVLGIAVSAPSGARFEHHGERAFVAASTVKIAVMVELFRQVDAGRRSLSDRHVLADEDRAPGSGVILHLDAGTSFSLADLAYLMISISDNTATNLLIELVGMDNVNATMRRLGMTGSNSRPLDEGAAGAARRERELGAAFGLCAADHRDPRGQGCLGEGLRQDGCAARAPAE